MLIKKKENSGLKHCNDPKFLLNSQLIWMVYLKILKNIIQVKKLKILIVFDEAIVDMLVIKSLVQY